MYIRYLLFIFLSMLFIICCSEKAPLDAYNPFDHVDPFIGTGHMGNGNPGATTPWGMITLTPYNIERGLSITKWNPRFYEHGQEYLYGFAHTALSEIGCGESGSVVIMPVFGELRWKPQDRRTHYSMEAANPGFYKVKLDEDLIFAELTTTARTGLSRFRFHNGWAYIILDLSSGLTNSQNGLVRITAPNEIVGYTYDVSVCDGSDARRLYFVAQFDRTAMGGGLYQGDTLYPDTVSEVEGEKIGAVFSFRTLDGSAIQVKVGLSTVSIENARLNLQTEQPNFSFSLTRQKAREQWEKELSKIRVYGGSEKHTRIFYTALYHSLLYARIFNDVNGDTPLINDAPVVRNVSGMNCYRISSLRDTYRTVHPLLSTFYPAQQLDIVRSLLLFCGEHNWQSRCSPSGDEIGVDISDPTVFVVADTYLKGLHDFDIEKAYQSIRRLAKQTAGEENTFPPALKAYDKYGYIPHECDQGHHLSRQNHSQDKVCGSVSTTLEYAFADWATAQLAKALKNDDYEFFINRSQNYKNIFDAETGFFRPRLENGTWLMPFDPLSVLPPPEQVPNDRMGYCKGFAWNYAFYVPHDMPGLIELLGQDAFITRLQTLFENNYFDLGIEPNLAFPFLFNYVDCEAWRTQKTVRDIIARHFDTSPTGFPDNGNRKTLSAWLVWAMMGLYPDCPASNMLQISTPFFDRIEIELSNDKYPGETFVIETKNLSNENIYIFTKKLNGKKLREFALDFADLVNGGTLQLTLKKK
ncbi:GH92 family glycosyl hydrolase [candidate division KSB1 bacterium]|nr:GH92 family glycosyl hydrolase [candidate division KSB1 bacterium]